jgi:hypothetical protein
LLSGEIESISVMGYIRDQLDAYCGRQPVKVLIEMIGTGLWFSAPRECEQAKPPS